MFKQFVIGSAMLVAMSGAALAGEQYVDETGFAISGYDVVAYFNLPQKDVGMMQPHAVPGKADITAEYNGATWAFVSQENRDMFLADPAKYAPKYDGHCAFGVAKGGKVPANPNLWRIVDGELYLNITPAVVGFWNADISGNINTAEGNWSGLESKAASDRSWMEITDNDGTYDMPAPVK
ncbi:YHS domain-containing (seleno)protein [Thalassospira australica]|uniref:YHS domain-containing (seleno)protein n=1 Tax=Thalassospira australica TaxID=1528106 RepID=UPI000519FC17|nr:YHS domain-containing (seleno)protein [Thalassospira australica]